MHEMRVHSKKIFGQNVVEDVQNVDHFLSAVPLFIVLG